MAKHANLSALFKAIADAIRTKTGGTEAIIADDFPEAIEGISGGGSCADHTFTVEGVKYGFAPGMTWWGYMYALQLTASCDFIDFYGYVAPLWHIDTDENGNDMGEWLIDPETLCDVTPDDYIKPVTYGLTDNYEGV